MRSFFSKIFPVAIALLSCSAVMAQTENTDDEFGLAAYYHDDFTGRKTFYGITYNPNELTAAHMRHPLNTMLKITRLDNNKSVVVRVIDKGPYITGRVVDLSRAAAEKLGILKDGVAEVKVEVVSRSKATKAEKTAKEAVPSPAVSKETNKIPSNYDTQASDKTVAPKKEDAAKVETAAAKTSAKGSTAKPQLVGKEYQKYGLYKIALEKPGGKGFAVQVASLENYENVFQQVADLQAKWFDNILISIEKGDVNPIYKIMLGPFDTESAATNYVKNLQVKHKIKGFVVDLSATTY